MVTVDKEWQVSPVYIYENKVLDTDTHHHINQIDFKKLSQKPTCPKFPDN